MADAAVLKTVGGNPVRVRVPPSAPASQCGIPRFSKEGAGFVFVGNESPRESLGKRESFSSLSISLLLARAANRMYQFWPRLSGTGKYLLSEKRDILG
jgi:hypothetical protein